MRHEKGHQNNWYEREIEKPTLKSISISTCQDINEEGNFERCGGTSTNLFSFHSQNPVGENQAVRTLDFTTQVRRNNQSGRTK